MLQIEELYAIKDKLDDLISQLEYAEQTQVHCDLNAYRIRKPYIGTSSGYLDLSDIGRYIQDPRLEDTDLVDRFLLYHDSPADFGISPDAYEEVYQIIDKYDKSNGNDPVDEIFMRMSKQDQLEVLSIFESYM